MVTKSPKVIVEPSSSTSNLSKLTKHIIDTPTVYTGNVNPWKDYSSKIIHSPSFEAFSSEHSPEVEGTYDFENVHPSDSFCVHPDDSPHSDTCQSECHHRTISHLTLPETSLSTSIKTALPRNRSAKFLIKRHKSLETSKKQGIQWRQYIKTRDKVDDVSADEKTIPYSRSSPNLKLHETSRHIKKYISDDDSSSS